MIVMVDDNDDDDDDNEETARYYLVGPDNDGGDGSCSWGEGVIGNGLTVEHNCNSIHSNIISIITSVIAVPFVTCNCRSGRVTKVRGRGSLSLVETA